MRKGPLIMVSLLLISFILMFMFGCAEQNKEENVCGGKICPYGYTLSEDCSCIMDMTHNQTFNVQNGSTIQLFGDKYNVVLNPILSSDCNEQGLSVIINKIKQTTENETNETESYNFTKSVMLSGLYNNSYIKGNLTLEDYDYNIDIHLEPCDYTDPYVALKVYQDEDETDEIELDEGESYSVNGGEFKLDDVVVSTDSVDPFDGTFTMNKGDNEELGNNDYTLKLSDVQINTQKIRVGGQNVTREEGMQAVFEGDYSVKVDDINYHVDPASVNIDTETMEETDEFTAPDGSKVKVQNINVILNNCTLNCTVNMSNVTLNVKPYGASSYSTYTLNQGDILNVSDNLQLRIQNINIDVISNCTNETHVCEVDSKNVEIRFTKVGPSCSVYDKGAEFTVTYPNTTEETVTLDEGEEYHLTSDLILSIDSVNIELSKPDYSGNCEVQSSNVTFTFSPPTYACEITSKKAKFTVDRFDESDNGWATNSLTLLGVDINIDNITADVELNNGSCTVSNEKVSVSVSHDGYCHVNSEKVKVKIGDEVENLDKNEEFSVGESDIELIGFSYELNTKCEAKDKSATFEVKSPNIEEFNIFKGDEKTVGIFNIKIDNISMDTDLEGLDCNLINKSAHITINTDYDHVSKLVSEGDQVIIGGGKVIVKEINAEHPDVVEKWCTTKNVTATLNWIPMINVGADAEVDANLTEQSD
ncbi:hypothetical protein J7J90_00385 [Candidatus Micrarchaeota archaeon]|nr:hypothetical protein [Candidatus Micrarchaeota archaeon]